MSLPKEAIHRHQNYLNRRYFLKQGILGLGSLALGGLVGCSTNPNASNFATTHFPAKAKRVIFLHMAGAPSQLELFDYKPLLQQLDGQACPPSLLEGKRFAFIKGVPMMLEIGRA
ncbi:MAG: DUF1501 domain-containing protein, partial [Bacteroidota bacterium]